MSERNPWIDFVARAGEWSPADDYVQRLRDALDDGARLVGVRFDGRTREYIVLLSVNQQLSELRIPHSDSFTEWASETRTPMDTREDEVARMTMVLRDAFRTIQADVGEAYFDGLFGELVTRRMPTRTSARMGTHPSTGGLRPLGSPRLADLDGSVAEAAALLQVRWRYGAEEAASILDDALSTFAVERYHLEATDPLLPR